jgi:hypothetical protein
MNRLYKIGDALSQLLNVAFLPNHKETNANESVSGRAWRQGWLSTVIFIDWLFAWWEKDHCRLAYEADIQKARDFIKQHEERR